MSEHDRHEKDEEKVRVLIRRPLDAEGNLRAVDDEGNIGESAAEKAAAEQTAAESHAAMKDEINDCGCTNEQLPAIDFSTLIFSLATQAMCHLGELDHPEHKCKEVDLTMARQTIDIVAMLQEKTKGNLNQQEELLTRNLLTDLRMKFVQVSRHEGEKKKENK